MEKTKTDHGVHFINGYTTKTVYALKLFIPNHLLKHDSVYGLSVHPDHERHAVRSFSLAGFDTRLFIQSKKSVGKCP